MNEPEQLVLPPSVRVARDDEIPKSSREEDKISSNIYLTTGYSLVKNDNGAFDSFIEANVHNHDMWDVFIDLCNTILPDIAAPLIGLKDEELVFGPYTDKKLALNLLGNYSNSLVKDGFIHFGMIHQVEGVTDEVYVSSYKYFKIWSTNSKAVQSKLESYRIPRVDGLSFIDEFPRVTEAQNDLPRSHEIFQEIADRFHTLPEY